ncbi:patatin-like phospholipase family protein [Pistricoccus aurantiacus]|uniref:patatin-like phospholipase family protein n=1 Tax=Pistricoccus aurantiacus TaxID=1883414 RepID=UPI00164554F2|nr:patatin-like phospholipase family protein [Pistricoccus aurantiacus]
MAALLASCAHYPDNAPLEHYDPTTGYRLETLPSEDNSGSLLLALSFSGGGTRAAALAYGTLERLARTEIVWEGHRKRLLDEVDIISAVSGGSYTAAYYALYRERLFEDFEAEFLKRNVQGDITRKFLAPANLIRSWSPRFGRSDLVAEYLDDNLFHDATFADLQRQGRPFVLINASDLSLGTRFEFSQDQFDLLCSNLALYPLSRAVTASSAVPVALTPLTLRNHAGSCDYQEPDWVQAALMHRTASARRYYKATELRSYLDAERRPYIHLLDGALSDNTGLRALLDRILSREDPLGLAQALDTQKLRKVVLIMVSAETRPDLSVDRIGSVPTPVQVVRNVKDTPINRYSFETIELFKAYFDGWAQRPLEHEKERQPIEFYLIEVTLEAIEDELDRDDFMAIPTSLSLPSEQVDALREMAGHLLDESPGFQRC